MPHKRRIRAEDIVPDILNGMSHAELMRKYKLSRKGLKSAFTKLVRKGILTSQEIYRQVPAKPPETIVIDDLDSLARPHVTLNLPIDDLSQPGVTGTLWYVTERNFAVTGIKAASGDIRSFSIPCKRYLRADTIDFEAECLWTSRQSSSQPSVCAFRITKISTVDLALLRELLQVATLTVG
jgi:hypothetical protein